MTQRITLNRTRRPVELVSKRQLATMLNVDPTTVDRWRKRANNFPKGITLSDQIVRWRLRDVEEWIREREGSEA